MSSLLNKKALMMLYNSLIKRYLTYCISSWCFGNTTMIHKLQCSVNKFIRLIFNLNYRTSITYTMKENEILSIEKLFKFETANFMYRHFNNLLPSVFGHTLDQSILKNSTRKTRNGSNVFPKYCRLNLTKQSFKYKGSLMWNKIPDSIKNITPIKGFHRALKTFLLETTS